MATIWIAAGAIPFFFGSAIYILRFGLSPTSHILAWLSSLHPPGWRTSHFCYEASNWYGVGIPRNTPAEIIDKLDTEINAGLADPKMKPRLADFGGTPPRLARRFRKANRR